MNEATDLTVPLKIRIPRLPGADEAEAAEADPEKLSAGMTKALATPGMAAEDSRVLAPEPKPARKMSMLVFMGHPREASLCEGLGEAYADAALASGHQVRMVRLHELEFDVHERQQPLEPCLEELQEAILQADHLVFVFPVWWGSVPALLKGFLDRVFKAGFAFRERPEGGWEGLLGGRTAEILTTMDTPHWVFQQVLKAPAIRALRDATLRFCGVGPTRVTLFGPVVHSLPAQRQKWVAEAGRAAQTAEAWHRTGWRPRVRGWIAVARLQFYLLPALVVLVGAVAGARTYAAELAWTPLILTMLAAALVEFITVLTNERHDLPTDTMNRNSGPFTGGSRVLVQHQLSPKDLMVGRNVALGLLLTVMAALVWTAPGTGIALSVILGTGLALGLGYTAPPLKLSYRGLGELTVALTHSYVVLLAGYASQGGPMANVIPWALGTPLFLAVLPSILLAGLPDLEADEATGKRTMAVILGRRRLVKVAMGVTVASALVHLGLIPFSGWLLTVPLLLHAGWLLRGLLDYLARPQPGRMDGLLFRALSYMGWFALAPLVG